MSKQFNVSRSRDTLKCVENGLAMYFCESKQEHVICSNWLAGLVPKIKN